MSQPDSQPSPQDDEETFLLSSLTEEQVAVFKRKLKRELKSVAYITEYVKVSDVIDASQMQKASNLIRDSAETIVASKGNEILEQTAEAIEASWTDKEKALKWLTNFVSRTMRQAHIVETMKWIDTIAGKDLGIKPIPVPETKIAWAHLDDCVQEAVDLLQAPNNDILDSQEEESDEDSEDGDGDSDDS